MTLTAQEQDFARQHIDDDLAKLALIAHRYPDVSVQALLPRIAALRKLRAKVPSWFRFDLAVPPVVSVEQASSEQTAHFKASRCTGHRMLDLTGGLGVDAFFWAKSFDEVVYVERDPDLAKTARHNFALLGANNIRVEKAEAERFLCECAETFDLIYVDPARRDEHQRRVFRLEDCSPNVLALRDLLLEKAPRVWIKAAPLLDISLALEQLQSVERVLVVSVVGEVKEVLLQLGRTAKPAEEVPIEAVLLSSCGTQTFLFTQAEERNSTPIYAAPKGYLYEPDAALLKAGAFKTFAMRFELAKLHPHAHLYTSEQHLPDVPGRCFAVEAVLKYDRKTVHQHLAELKANVVVRHFPDTAEKVRQRLGLSEGGNKYLFGTTTPDGQKLLVLCRPTLTLV